jgi:hypothetical protein
MKERAKCLIISTAIAAPPNAVFWTGFRSLIGEISRSSLAAIINNKRFINLVREKVRQFGSLERGYQLAVFIR